MNKLILLLNFVFLSIAYPIANSVHAEETAWRQTSEVEGISEFILPNDCRVVLIPDPSASSITVNMTVLVGSRHEGYGETGMAHLLEHMLFKGTPLHTNLDKELKERGVLDMNGTTDYDRTNYYETLPASAENLDWAISIEADRMVNCYIRGEDLFSEMTVVRNEFESGEDSPQSILMQRMMANAYEWHNYGKSVIGNRADIERVPVNRLRAFYKKYYRPDNVVLFLAGRFDPKIAIAAAAKHFGAIAKPSIPLEATYTAEPTQDGERVVYLNRVGDVPMIGVGFHMPSAADPDSAPLNVLQYILGDEPSGRLYQNLVKTHQASFVAAMMQPGYDPGFFSCLIKVESSAKVDSVRDLLNQTIASIAKEGVTQEEVTRAIKKLQNEKDTAQTNTASLAHELSNWMAYGDWRLFYIHRDRIENVTREDVQRVASVYLKESNRTTGIFVPTPQPDRSQIAQRPSLESLISTYRGRDTISKGEAFEPTPENIAARTIRGKLQSGLSYALLPKQVRGDRFFLKLSLRYGNESTLNTSKQLKAAQLIGDSWLQGTKKYNEEKLKDKLDELQAELTASSEPGEVTFQLTGRKKSFEESLELLAEVLRNPAFPDEEFSLSKSQLRSQLESQRTDPNYLAQLELNRKISPFSAESIHYVPTIDERLQRLEAAQSSDVKDLYARFLTGTYGEVTVVGAFDKDIALDKLNSMMADWKSNESYSRIVKPLVETKPEVISIETPDKENAVMLGAASLDVRSDDPDWEALYIANDILGGGSLTSRLGTRVREQEGLSYGVGSQFIAKAHGRAGMFMIYAITNPINRDKLLKTVDQVLDEIVKSGVTEAEIESARTSYLKQLDDILSSDVQLMETLHQYQAANRDETFIARRQRNMEQLSKAKVDAVIQKLLCQKKLVIVTAGDFRGKITSAQKADSTPLAQIQAIPGIVIQEKEGVPIGMDLRGCGDGWTEMFPQMLKLPSLQSIMMAGPFANHDRVISLAELPNLKTLRLDQANVDDTTIAVVASFPKIEELSLDRCAITDVALESISRNKSIKRIRFPGSRITNAGLAHLKNMTQLELLDLNDCNQISSEGVVHLKGLTKLRNLSLWGPGITDKAMSSLSGMTNMAAISFRKCSLTDSGFAALSGMTKLKEFDIFQTPVGDRALAAVSGANEMSKLKLRGSAITSKGIVEQIGKFENLIAIDLGETSIDDVALTSLSQLKKLEDLNLLRTRITDAGLTSIVGLKLKRLNLDDIAGIGDGAIPIIAKMNSLEFLHLGKTHVTDDGIQGLSMLTNLKDLIVTNTLVSDGAVQSLQAKLPKLKIKSGNDPAK